MPNCPARRLRVEALEGRSLPNAAPFTETISGPARAPGDALFSRQWDFSNVGQGGVVHADAGAGLAWNAVNAGRVPSATLGPAFVERGGPLRSQAVFESGVLLPAWTAEKPHGPVWNAFEAHSEGPRFTTPSSSVATVITTPGPVPENTTPGAATGAEGEGPDTSALDELFSGPLDDLLFGDQW